MKKCLKWRNRKENEKKKLRRKSAPQWPISEPRAPQVTNLAGYVLTSLPVWRLR